MSAYYPRYCAKHGEYGADIDGDQECEKCVAEGQTLMQMLLRDLAAAKAKLSKAKKKYLQVCDQHGRLVDQVYEEDGETLKHISAEARAAAAEKDARRLQFLVDNEDFQIEYTGELTLREHIDAAIEGEKK